MRNEGKEGCFLVRDSSQRGMYTLSLFTTEKYATNNCTHTHTVALNLLNFEPEVDYCCCCCSREPVTRHYHIKINAAGKFYLSEKFSFLTIPELIYYHKHNSGGMLCFTFQAVFTRVNAHINIDKYMYLNF